ncbi:MAG: ferrous iron transport protein A [Candidatus Bathyarchaeia archaeon]
MSSEEKIVEVLELVRTAEVKNRVTRLEEMAHELESSTSEVERLVEEALSKRYLKRDGDMLKLTRRGFKVLQRHRERYVHEKFTHRPSLIGRLARFFEGNIRDWRSHWRHRHGLDEKSINSFYKDIRMLNGRIEETLPLISLKPGERGTVAFAFGGRGLVRRLAEMGLTPGTEVKIVRSAPFHGPLEIEVRGSSLALGYGVASKVFVKKQARAN